MPSIKPYYSEDGITIYHGDMREVVPQLTERVDYVLTDPPYGLSKEPDIEEVMKHWIAGDEYNHKSNGFMGKSWDSFVPGPKYWEVVLRAMKPGAMAMVFGGTRTQDLLSIALRFSGFQIRDTLMWLYGQGFPKSLSISKQFDSMEYKRREEAIKAALKAKGFKDVIWSNDHE